LQLRKYHTKREVGMMGGHGKRRLPKPLQRHLLSFCCSGFKHTSKATPGDIDCFP